MVTTSGTGSGSGSGFLGGSGVTGDVGPSPPPQAASSRTISSIFRITHLRKLFECRQLDLGTQPRRAAFHVVHRERANVRRAVALGPAHQPPAEIASNSFIFSHSHRRSRPCVISTLLR